VFELPKNKRSKNGVSPRLSPEESIVGVRFLEGGSSLPTSKRVWGRCKLLQGRGRGGAPTAQRFFFYNLRLLKVKQPQKSPNLAARRGIAPPTPWRARNYMSSGVVMNCSKRGSTP